LPLAERATSLNNILPKAIPAVLEGLLIEILANSFGYGNF
jgi:hypothetical protein